MKEFPKYPSIEGLHRNPRILEHECVVTEKIHGTNVRFMWSPEDGGWIIGSREHVIYQDGIRRELYGFVQWVLDDNLGEAVKDFPGIVFYGEWFGPGVQKGISYSNYKQLRIFDIRDLSGNLADWEKVEETCKNAHLEAVPVIYEGKITLEYLESIRNFTSIVGHQQGVSSPENIWEGVVIKPLKMQKDQRGNWLMAKYKSKKWAENVGHSEPKDLDPTKVAIQNAAKLFATTTVTNGRVATICDHITRDGNTTLDMTRTPEFLRELVKDISEEYKDTFSQLDKEKQNIFNKAISTLGRQLWQQKVEEVK